jgi:hypothetical protein
MLSTKGSWQWYRINWLSGHHPSSSSHLNRFGDWAVFVNSAQSTALVRNHTSTKQYHILYKQKQTPWPESVSELYRPSDRCLSAKLVPTFADRRCHVVSVTNPYGRNLGFLDRSRYFFFQAAPQLYSRGWVDPVPDPILLRKSGRAGNRTRTSGSVAGTLTTRPQRWSSGNDWCVHTSEMRMGGGSERREETRSIA